MSDEVRLGKIDDCVRNNEEFERAILKKLYKDEDVGLASESESESQPENSSSKDSSGSSTEEEN